MEGYTIRPTMNRTPYERNGKFGCCAAWTWLFSIIIIEAIFMLGWLTREYFFFDYRCVMKESNGHEDLGYFLENIKRRALPTIEIRKANGNSGIGNSSLYDDKTVRDTEPFMIGFDVETHVRKRSVEHSDMNKPQNGHKIRKKHPVESVVRVERLPITSGNKSLRTKTTRTRLTSNTTRLYKKQYQKKKAFGENSDTIKIAPEVSWEDEENNGNVVKRYHLLSGGASPKGFNSKEEENEHRSNWLHGVIDPEDPNFSNKGHIRIYPMQIADERPQPDAEYIRKLLNLTDPIPTSTTRAFFEVVEDGVKVATTASPILRTTLADIRNRKEGRTDKTTLSIVTTSIASTTEEIPTPDTSTASPVPTTSPPELEVFFDDRLIYKQGDKENGTVTATTTLTPQIDRPTSIPRISLPSFKIETRKMDFLEQLDAFTSGAMCIMRTILILWCLAQCFSSIPFLLGISLRVRCFLIPHLILDALLLVVLFVLSVTITVFSLILYWLVEEMTSYELQEWLAFSLILVVLLISYSAIFMVTLKCSELVLNENAKPLSEQRRDYEPLETRQLV